MHTHTHTHTHTHKHTQGYIPISLTRACRKALEMASPESIIDVCTFCVFRFFFRYADFHSKIMLVDDKCISIKNKGHPNFILQYN